MMKGIRKEKVPGLSKTPAPVAEVELVELLWVSVATVVVVLELEVEFPEGVGTVLLEITCCFTKKSRGWGWWRGVRRVMICSVLDLFQKDS